MVFMVFDAAGTITRTNADGNIFKNLLGRSVGHDFCYGWAGSCREFGRRSRRRIRLAHLVCDPVGDSASENSSGSFLLATLPVGNVVCSPTGDFVGITVGVPVGDFVGHIVGRILWAFLEGLLVGEFCWSSCSTRLRRSRSRCLSNQWRPSWTGCVAVGLPRRWLSCWDRCQSRNRRASWAACRRRCWLPDGLDIGEVVRKEVDPTIVEPAGLIVLRGAVGLPDGLDDVEAV